MSDKIHATNSKNMDINEDILTESANRFVLFPIRYKSIWEMYKKAEAAFWTAEEIDLSKDWSDWEKLTDNERHFIKHVLAFFAGSDGIVNENLSVRFMNDVKPQEAKSFYGFQIAMENIHCVTGQTEIYTKTGYVPIQKIAGQTVEVWNGHEWSTTTVYKTASNAEIFRVTLSNGMSLDCTSEHKWIVAAGTESEGSQRMITKDLQVGTTIAKFAYPEYHNLTDPDIWCNPYEHGFMTGVTDGSKQYIPTMFNCRDQFTVPINFSLPTKTAWLTGFFKHATIVPHSNDKFITITNPHRQFMKNVQLLLTTLGIHSNLTFSSGLGAHRITINSHHANALANGGIIDTPSLNYPENDDALVNPVITVVSVNPLPERADTYCFDEPIRHAGIFNGILTGQSETYSVLIDTYIRDPQEKYRLLNAINTIPCIRKKADWAVKWIEDKNSSFAHRLVAFACVEGIFFSGAFCSIFWLKERGVMPGLCLSNEFISRDEALHTEFAVLLYNMLQNRLSKETINEIVSEAVEIEDEFINESIPCRLLGMNSDLMSQYIRYVADRLVVQLGYEKIFNVTNPFHFMDRINLEHKANFFEDRNSQYSIANVGNTNVHNTAFNFADNADF